MIHDERRTTTNSRRPQVMEISQLVSADGPQHINIRAMAKIGYTRNPDGQNRVPPSTLVPGRHLIGQRPPRPDSGRISNGSTRFWLLTPPSATRFQSNLPDYGRAFCTLFIFLRAKKIRQPKNYTIIAPPQHDTLRCFLDVLFFRGVRSIFQKTSLISSHSCSIV